MKHILFIAMSLSVGVVSGVDLSVADYSSIQDALNANPDRMVFLPAGDYVIREKIRIRGERSGLFGPGRIIQENPEHPIVEIENANGAEIRDVTLTRPEGKQETSKEGIIAISCRDLVIENVRVLDNRGPAGAITVRECRDSRVSRCLVRNYMRVSIDDRTQSPDWGYAFHCTDGTGVSVSYSSGTLIEGNRIVEENLRPTPEVKAKYRLGEFAKKNPEKGIVTNQQTWDAEYTDNWQQGSGLIVTAPSVSEFTRILGNHIENAAQGIDLHCDRVIVANNLITNSFMGMKAMHGSRNVLITGNQFHRNCLWAIGLMPGAGATPGEPGKPETANSDGGSIVSDNIISGFGEGDSAWIWGEERSPFKFGTGQQADDPPLVNVLVRGNLIDSVGPPHYSYAVIIEGGPNEPKGLIFEGNQFPPGNRGVVNREWEGLTSEKP